MKYKVGQKVKIRSLVWYRNNVNRYGIIECGKYEFFEPMNEYCGKVVTIKRIDDDNYRIDADKGAFCWTDEMIEGLVEEENTLSKNAKLVSERFAEYVNPSEFKHSQDTIMKMLLQGAINLPEGYQFVDENGNVINATKIVLEKKKKEYPKTCEECVNVLGMTYHDIVEIRGDDIPKKYGNVLDCLYKLLICRDAYWKIAGDWKPEFGGEPYYYIDVANYKVNKGVINGLTNCTRNMILVFPEYKMRDAFYENFKELIEYVKELL